MTYLVSEDADGVTGYVVVSIAGDIADLQRLGVTQRVRRTGVAGKLLDLAITTAIMANGAHPTGCSSKCA
ncbi:MAG: GNAT family N-acetyltransferase [Nocardioidaceae bacterium]